MKTLDAICHHLSMQCRYAGAVKRFYSVAEHTVHMVRQARADGMPAGTQLKIWLHDAPEYILGDIVWSVKNEPGIREVVKPLEEQEMKRIANVLGVPRKTAVDALSCFTVKQYDHAIAAAETQHVAIPKPGLIPFDRSNALHVALLTRLRQGAPHGANMQHWQLAMLEEYEIITDAMS